MVFCSWLLNSGGVYPSGINSNVHAVLYETSTDNMAMSFALLTILLVVSIHGNSIRKERGVFPLPILTCNDIKCPKGYHCQLQDCSSRDNCGASICCRPDDILDKPGRSCEPLDFIRNTNMCPRRYHVDRALSINDQCCWNVTCTQCPLYKCAPCCINSIDEFGCGYCNCGINPACPP